MSTNRPSLISCPRSLRNFWLFVIILAGCGAAYPGRVEVSGSVSYDGEPIEDGLIRFIPEGATRGSIAQGKIIDGQYHIDHLGGVAVGTNRVEIRAYDPKVPEPMGPGIPPREQLLPERFNKESELITTVENSRSVIELNFDLRP